MDHALQPPGGRGSEKHFGFHGCINSERTTHRIILSRTKTHLIELKGTFVLFVLPLRGETEQLRC